MEALPRMRGGQSEESPSNDAPSISGVRVAVSPPEAPRDVVAPGSGPHLRGMVVTVEPSRAPPERTDAREQFQVEFAHDTQFFAGLSHDMSFGGILIATYRDLPVGSRVHLDFELPTGVPIHAWGEIRSVREESATYRRGLAIAFREISAESLQHISEYCRVYPPLFLDLDG